MGSSEEIIQILEFDRYIPKGKEWNKRALFMPDNAVPFQKSGRVLTIPPGTVGKAIEFRVPPNVNGLRISEIVFACIIVDIDVLIQLTKNGVTADPALSGPWWNVQGSGSQAILFRFNVFAFYEPGDIGTFELNNTGLSNGPNLFGFLKGWYF